MTNWNRLYDFDSEHSRTYEKKCKCGKKHTVSAQKDEGAEYITEIYIKCECGKSVRFNLPVN